MVTIDGSRLKAFNAKANNYMQGKLRQELGELNKAIEHYLGELDHADEVLGQTRMVLPDAHRDGSNDAF